MRDYELGSLWRETPDRPMLYRAANVNRIQNGARHATHRLCTAPETIAAALQDYCDKASLPSLIEAVQREWDPLWDRIVRDVGVNQRKLFGTPEECMHASIAGLTGECIGQHAIATTIAREPLMREWDVLSASAGTALRMHRGFWRFNAPYNVAFYRKYEDVLNNENTLTEVDMICTYGKNSDHIVLVDFCMPHNLQRKADKERRTLPKIISMCGKIGADVTKLHAMFVDKNNSLTFCNPMRTEDGEPIPNSFRTLVPLKQSIVDVIQGMKHAARNGYTRSSFRRYFESAGVQ